MKIKYYRCDCQACIHTRNMYGKINYYKLVDGKLYWFVMGRKWVHDPSIDPNNNDLTEITEQEVFLELL